MRYGKRYLAGVCFSRESPFENRGIETQRKHLKNVLITPMPSARFAGERSNWDGW